MSEFKEQLKKYSNSPKGTIRFAAGQAATGGADQEARETRDRAEDLKKRS